MTPQEIFDTVARHLFTQGKRAHDYVQDICCYRTEDGLSCAVGCLIPDDVYDQDMEGSKVSYLIMSLRFRDKLPAWMEDNIGLLRSLQHIHDDILCWGSTQVMREELRKRAIAYKLDASVLDTLSFGDR